MRHPPHAKDRCCRVCYAIAVTADPDDVRRAAYILAPAERAERRRTMLKATRVAELVHRWLPASRGADWRDARRDRARTRTSAGLQQLYESTGERDG